MPERPSLNVYDLHITVIGNVSTTEYLLKVPIRIALARTVFTALLVHNI